MIGRDGSTGYVELIVVDSEEQPGSFKESAQLDSEPQLWYCHNT